MQSKFAILAAFVAAAAAAVCPLDQLGGLTVVTNSVSPLQTRWDVFTVNSGAVNVGDVGWFRNNQPNGNEVFKAQAVGTSGHFTFTRRGGQDIGVSGTTAGSRLIASTTTATFNVNCGSCFQASGNAVAAENCGIQLVNGDGTLSNLCVNFQSDAVARLLECNDSNSNQNILIFSAP
ncbi:hypothetical protein B0H19DRAFT_1238746 [Mycena capillaripes]|nr:hypothetical protein B0H19DRAFT_1238746 [Mycena capillaripes]